MHNGSWAKTVLSDAGGEGGIEVPRDREGTFEPQIVARRLATLPPGAAEPTHVPQ